MITGLDHVVHFTKQPESAKNAFELLGLNALYGGDHPNWGTYNCLSFYERLAYIEWIGIQNRQVAEHSDNPLIQQIAWDAAAEREGFSQLAFRTDRLLNLKDHLEAEGHETIGPVHGQRKKGDGSLLEWSMLFLKQDDHSPIRYPFFIEWGQPDTVRERELAALMEHPTGRSELDYVGFNCVNPSVWADRYGSVLMAERQPEEKQDEFGAYFELRIHWTSVRFYDHSDSSFRDLSPHPVIVGIKGSTTNGLQKMAGGAYHFHE
ncbi:VOC family protein [Pseudalkalibacillus sp. Hm43]|uniref:VOC family protein n=1 Tax=Pseudalkalibacillus sp. Hm43 TaxID=3450742 RepID=UPI003F4416C6